VTLAYPESTSPCGAHSLLVVMTLWYSEAAVISTECDTPSISGIVTRQERTGMWRQGPREFHFSGVHLLSNLLAPRAARLPPPPKKQPRPNR